MKKSHRLSGIILIALILTVATFAFAAANSMPGTSSAGEGATEITGYTISAVHYTLNSTNPANIDTVTLTIAPTTATDVSIQLVTSGDWIDCTNASGTVTCDASVMTTPVTAQAANNLRVVAAD